MARTDDDKHPSDAVAGLCGRADLSNQPARCSTPNAGARKRLINQRFSADIEGATSWKGSGARAKNTQQIL
jgi:hypothetical protein